MVVTYKAVPCLSKNLRSRNSLYNPSIIVRLHICDPTTAQLQQDFGDNSSVCFMHEPCTIQILQEKKPMILSALCSPDMGPNVQYEYVAIIDMCRKCKLSHSQEILRIFRLIFKCPSTMDGVNAGTPSTMRETSMHSKSLPQRKSMIVKSSKSYLLFFQKLLHRSICCSDAEVLQGKDNARRLGPDPIMLQKMNLSKYHITFKSLPE